MTAQESHDCSQSNEDTKPMCMYDPYNDGPVELIHDASHKARKAHTCHECYRQIHPGETYRLECYKEDLGTSRAHKTCAHCEAVRNWIRDECGGWFYGFVREDIEEHIGEFGMPMARIAISMRRKWARRDGRLMPIPKMPGVTQ